MFSTNGPVRSSGDQLRILSVGAQEDDIEAGSGGLLSVLAASGAKLTLSELTCGERGGDPKIRRHEAQVAAELINASLIWGHLPDTRLRLRDAIAVVEKAVLDSEPTWVLVHSPKDTHQDHRVAAWATLSAAPFGPEHCVLRRTLLDRFHSDMLH